jgi:hypothetical protein
MPLLKLSERIRSERSDFDNLMKIREEERIRNERAAQLTEEERKRKLKSTIFITVISIVGPFIIAGLVAVGNGNSFVSGVLGLLNIIKWIIIVAVILIIIALVSK